MRQPDKLGLLNWSFYSCSFQLLLKTNVSLFVDRSMLALARIEPLIHRHYGSGFAAQYSVHPIISVGFLNGSGRSIASSIHVSSTDLVEKAKTPDDSNRPVRLIFVDQANGPDTKAVDAFLDVHVLPRYEALKRIAQWQ
jgi:hypothetical protein